MSQVVCTCPRDNLCHDCLARSLQWLAGVSDSRGYSWASSVAERRPDLLERPWPVLEGRAAELAAAKVADLSQDLRVLERLIDKLDTAARRRWEELRARAPAAPWPGHAPARGRRLAR